MARIFSIDFVFRQQQYTALVTASAAADETARYTIVPNDDSLKQLLPGGRFSFGTLTDLQPLAETHPRLHELVLCMAMALYQKADPPATKTGRLQP